MFKLYNNDVFEGYFSISKVIDYVSQVREDEYINDNGYIDDIDERNINIYLSIIEEHMKHMMIDEEYYMADIKVIKIQYTDYFGDI